MTRELLNLYKGKTILVTGDSGFKGGWLAMILKHLGAEVVGFSLQPPTEPSFFDVTSLSGRIQHFDGDIRDRELVMRVMADNRPDLVFHLAAQPIVRRSYIYPAETMEINIMGTVNVLEAVRANNEIGACVCITSDKCYQNHELEYSYRENDALGGSDPYSASKGAAEIVIASYRDSFFSKTPTSDDRKPVICSTRAGNVIGGGDWGVDRLVPDCVRALAEGRQIQIRNPGSIRPWQFVLEPLYGYLLLGAKVFTESPALGGAWNFGPPPGSGMNVAGMADLIVRAWGHGSWKAVDSRGSVPEARTLRLDSTKAYHNLGWKCRYDIQETILRTVSWYTAYYEGRKDMYEFSHRQITDYLDMVEENSY